MLAVSEDPPRLSAEFPGRPGGPVILSSRDPALVRFRFAPDTAALLADGTAARVLRPLAGPGQDLYRYTVEVPGKKPQLRSEADLRAPVPREGPAEHLASGRWGTPEDFHLRAEAVRLDLERRADALGALFASRVYVMPHQVSVAHHVLAAPQPRFVLADEVGLGKTIEAGLVLSGLLHAGLVKRCLVVAPSHLTVQWLAELFHKFNLLFTLMDPDRARDDREAADAEAPEDEDSPWARHPLVITSLEWLSRSAQETKDAAQAGWDLVIVDEAHHLRGERAYEVAQALARRTWGLILITATPLQLDPAEYHALLRLVDPAPAATEDELRARLARQGDLSAQVRALLAGEAAAAGRIAELFPGDPALRELRGPALLDHLAESYGLSSRLLRNRRAVVGGFTPRRLGRIEVQLTAPERALEEDVRKALASAKLPSARCWPRSCGAWAARRPRSRQGSPTSGRRSWRSARSRSSTTPSWPPSTRSWKSWARGRRCWCSPSRARRWSTCARRCSASGSRRWPTPGISRLRSGTNWWRASAIPTGPACSSAPSWAARAATSSTATCW